MRAGWVLCGVLAVMLSGAPIERASAQVNEYAVTRARTLYQQLSNDATCESALPAARTFWASADFRTLPQPFREALLLGIMSCAWTLRDGATAIAAAQEAHDLGAAWPDYYRMQLGLAFGNDVLATRAFFEFAENDREQFAAMPGRFVFRSLQAAHRVDPSDAMALRMHDKLIALRWTDPDGTPDDGLRLEHARLLMQHQQIDRARSRLETVIDPQIVLKLRINRLYDSLRGDPAFERRLDLVAAAEASLTRARTMSHDQPRSLGAVLDVARALRTLGRSDEALAELDRAISLAQAPNGQAAFDDHADQLNWLLNEKAYVLYDLGRAGEAREVFGASIAVGEHGNWSVSQVINFAQALETEGRAADALEVLRTVGEASPYGDMWTASVRACAAEQTGDAAVRGQTLAFLLEHEEDNVAARTRALICVNDQGAAAALLIRRLADPTKREGALIALQRYRENTAHRSPREATMYERLAQVRDRADVRRAVEAVGRIEDVPLFATYWGDV